MSPRPNVTMTDDEIAAFLTEARTATFCTLGPDGAPHLSGMWFLYDGPTVRMWTYAKSQKAVNARRDPRAAVMVEEGVRYDDLRGVSLRGTVEVTDRYEDVRSVGAELYERYSRPFTGLPLEGPVLAEVERQARKRVALTFHVESVASWDHSKLS